MTIDKNIDISKFEKGMLDAENLTGINPLELWINEKIKQKSIENNNKNKQEDK